MARESFYRILGVSEDATQKDIDKAYRKKALVFHPDKNRGLNTDDAAVVAEKFALAKEAYETLSDEKKRTTYDTFQRVKHYGEEAESNVEISGYLTHPRKPISSSFKEMYTKYVDEFTAQPASVNLREPKKWESPLLFKTLRDYAESASIPEPIIFEGTLTPELAVSLFRKFLSREYYGVQVTGLKHYIHNAIIKAENTHTHEATLGLYRGISNIVSMVEDEESESKLYASLQMIFNFAKESALLKGSSPMVYLEPMIQSFEFRDLISAALPKSWEQLDSRPLQAQVQEQFTSKLDTKISEDDTGKLGIYYHRLHGFQKKMLKLINQELKAETLREMAYLCIDFIPFLAGSPAITINLFQQGAFLFQKASTLEQDAYIKMADEQMAVQLCLQASVTARKEAPFTDIPVHQNTLRIFNQLTYKNIRADIMRHEIEHHITIKSKVLPCFETLSSPLDVMLRNEINEAFAAKVFDILIMCIDHSIKIDYTKDDVYSEAFSSSLKWYKPDDVKKLRLDAMNAYLETKGWTFDDLALNLHNNELMVRLDDDKYIDWNKPTPYPKGMKTYQSIEGIEVDTQHGKVNLVLKPFKEGDPAYKEAITDCDVLELIEREIDGVYFSLDQENPERQKDPFQKIIFGPETLHQTGLLTALLHADYLLKFLTTGQEVQADYPFDIRPIDKRLETLPGHLRKVIDNFRDSASSNDTHRFWIEGTVVPTLKEEIEEEGKTRYTLGDIHMAVKKHRMKLNAKGEAIDTDDDSEGWTLYELDSNQVATLKQDTSKLQSPAIIRLKNTNQFYFLEDSQLSQKPEAITVPESLLSELSAQKTNADGSVMRRKANRREKIADNFDFLYDITCAITQASGRDSHFSKEEIFAREFTKHYDEFSVHFPIFERLRQLAKVTSVVGIMVNHRENNKLNISLLENQANDPAYWVKKGADIKAALSAAQCVHLQKVFAEVAGGYTKALTSHTTMLQSVINQINSQPPLAQVHANSPEIIIRCNEIYNDIYQDLVNQHGTAAANAEAHNIRTVAINPHIPAMVTNYNTEINAANAARTANYRQQVYNLHLDLGLPLATYNNLINQFMAGNIHPLAQALATKTHAEGVQTFNQQFRATFAEYPAAEVEMAINGSPAPLAASIAVEQVVEHIAAAKAHHHQVILHRKTLEGAFVGWSLSASAKQTFDLKDNCNLVPASHANDGHHRVYGGAILDPEIQTQAMADAAIRSLQLPTVSAFSTHLGSNIASAKSLISHIERSASSLPTGVSSLPTYLLLHSLNDAIRRAETARADMARQEHRDWLTKIKNSFMGGAQPSRPRPKPEEITPPSYTPPPPRPPVPPAPPAAAYSPPKGGIPKAAAIIATGMSLAASGAEAKLSAVQAPQSARSYTVSAASTAKIAPLHTTINASNARVDAVNNMHQLSNQAIQLIHSPVPAIHAGTVSTTNPTSGQDLTKYLMTFPLGDNRPRVFRDQVKNLYTPVLYERLNEYKIPRPKETAQYEHEKLLSQQPQGVKPYNRKASSDPDSPSIFMLAGEPSITHTTLFKGKGVSGKIKIHITASGREVAVKSFTIESKKHHRDDVDGLKRKSYENEVKVLKAMGRLLGHGINKKSEDEVKAYVAMPYYDAISLKTYIESGNKLDQKQSLKMMQLMVQEVKELHSHGYIHCDIHPDNFLINIKEQGREVVKLIDFSFSLKKGAAFESSPLAKKVPFVENLSFNVTEGTDLKSLNGFRGLFMVFDQLAAVTNSDSIQYEERVHHIIEKLSDEKLTLNELESELKSLEQLMNKQRMSIK